MARKIFFHVDVNSAYLSWEAVRRKEKYPEKEDLRDIPSAICGDPSKRSGIILAKSIPAKNFGVKTGEPIYSARKKCPNLYLVSSDFDLYIASSKALMDILNRFSPNVYQYSIDEAFMDMTGTERLFGNPILCADKIRKVVKEELGFTINIGISSNMVLAKMAGDFTKPDKTHTLFQDEIKKKMWPLDVSELFFVGRKTSEKLRRFGINTIGQLATTDVDFLRKYFKKHGEVIHNHANGLEGYVFLHENVKNRSIGNSTTTAFDITDINTANELILSLSETVCARLRAKNVFPSVVGIEILNIDFKRSRIQKKLNFRTNSLDIIYRESKNLLLALWDKVPLRHIGIWTSNVEEKNKSQLNFFDEIKDKNEKLYIAIDKIRDKYGEDSIKRARFLNSEFSHMEGGTSKNKKNGIIYL